MTELVGVGALAIVSNQILLSHQAPEIANKEQLESNIARPNVKLGSLSQQDSV